MTPNVRLAYMRCLGERSCPWRFTTPRDCGQHYGGDTRLVMAAEALGITLEQPPDIRGRGERGDGDGGKLKSSKFWPS